MSQESEKPMHSSICGCPVCQGLERRGGDKLPETFIYEKPKRLLIVYSTIAFRREDIATMCEWMTHRGFNLWAIQTFDVDAPDIRVFDLDGAPAPDTGLIQQLLASIVNDPLAGASASRDECSGAVAIAESEMQKKEASST